MLYFDGSDNLLKEYSCYINDFGFDAEERWIEDQLARTFIKEAKREMTYEEEKAELVQYGAKPCKWSDI